MGGSPELEGSSELEPSWELELSSELELLVSAVLDDVGSAVVLEEDVSPGVAGSSALQAAMKSASAGLVMRIVISTRAYQSAAPVSWGRVRGHHTEQLYSRSELQRLLG